MAAGIATARLDCLVLLEDTTGHDKSWLLAHPEHKLQESDLIILNTKIEQRASHIPLAYIRKQSEFYGRKFFIDERVLEPRPESETLIDLLKLLSPQPSTIIDVGTGSGAIGISAKLEIPNATVWATDIDQNCLDVAKINAEKHSANINFAEGNLLLALRDRKSKIENPTLVCNLPYVPNSFKINRAALHEPKHAIFGGPTGLELYDKLFAQISSLKTVSPIFVLTESMPPQHDQLRQIAKLAGFELLEEVDFIQVFAKKS